MTTESPAFFSTDVPVRSEAKVVGNHRPGESRICDKTGLPVCLHAQLFVRWNLMTALLFLVVGSVAALLVAFTRWPAVHLLDAVWYYRMVTAHGWNMLIFWIFFLEIAFFYYIGTTLLNCRLASRKAAEIAFYMMAVGASTVDYTIMAGHADVMLTSYIPLRAHWAFYIGVIVFAVGALVAVINFLCTIYIARRDKTYQGSVPLVVFGGLAAAIIAVVTLFHGAVAMLPTFFWSFGMAEVLDPGWYRLTWWALGHSSQQINVCLMVSAWYMIGSLTTGAKPINQAVCRGAFVLYILFINVASAHHLLVDPGVTAEWKIWNTSYAMYLAVLASMVHGFTVPASVEVAMRAKGHTRGRFGWLAAAPWKNPGFAAFFLSLVIFGFGGGITGVTLGTPQINIIAHNTLRIPGHFHVTVAGGTTLAFMGLTYYLLPMMFQREYLAKGLVRLQPYVFAIGIVMVATGMSFAGSAGVPRRHWDIEFTGAALTAGFDSSAHIMLGLMGVGAVIAVLGMAMFLGLTALAVAFGRSNVGEKQDSWGIAKVIASVSEGHGKDKHDEHHTPGTMTLVIVLLVCFAVYYFGNWKALADVWHVR